MIKVLLVQSKLCESKAKAIEYFQRIVNSRQIDNSDIICFPELWYLNVVNNFEREFATVLDLAKQKTVFIIPGAFLERIDDEISVSCPLISKKGKIIGRQLKIHPFGLQRKDVKPGIKAEVFNLGKFKWVLLYVTMPFFQRCRECLQQKVQTCYSFRQKLKPKVSDLGIYIYKQEH